MADKKPIEEYEYKSKEERLAMLKKTAREINKEHGLDTLHFANEHPDIERIPFGMKEFDDLTGGGIPHGNFFTVWGAPGCGKSTIAHMLTASAQNQGKLAYYIALEPYDQARAIQFGVNVDSLMIGQFPKAEQSLDTIIEFSRKRLVDFIILDSIHSLSPEGEQEDKKGEKSVADDTMALLARKLSQFFRMAIDPVKRGNVAVLMIGQTRMNLGGYVVIEKLSGGNALHHYSKGILQMSKGQKADAPTEKKATGDLTPGGNTSYETVQIGFDCSIKINKCQIEGMSSEGTNLHLPYYYDTGFYLPTHIKEQIAQEEKEISQQTKVEETPLPQPQEPKKKRGRPRKESNNEQKQS